MMIATGIKAVQCYKKPRLAVLVSSRELRAGDLPIAPGKMPDYKGRFLCSLLCSWGFPDVDIQYINVEPETEFNTISESVSKILAEYDFVVSCGDATDRQAATLGLDSLRLTKNQPAPFHGCQPGNLSILFRGERRAPDVIEQTPLVDEKTGRAYGQQTIFYIDACWMVHIAGRGLGIPGTMADLLAGMLLVARPMLDDIEGVQKVGPDWTAGVLADDVQQQAHHGLILMCKVSVDNEGRNRLSIIPDPVFELHPSLLDIDGVAYVRQGTGTLPAGSVVSWTRVLA